MSLFDYAIAVEWVVFAAIVGYRFGRGRGGRQVLDAAASMLAQARADGVAEGAALLQAVELQHECTETTCSIEAQRERAHLQ